MTDTTDNALASTNRYISSDPVFTGDVNGDGRNDMIVHWTSSTGYRHLLTYIANSNTIYNAGVDFTTNNVSNPSIYAGTYLVGDVDGDGRDDFIVKWKGGNNDSVRFLVYRGLSTGTFQTGIHTYPSINIPYYNFDSN